MLVSFICLFVFPFILQTFFNCLTILDCLYIFKNGATWKTSGFSVYMGWSCPQKDFDLGWVALHKGPYKLRDPEVFLCGAKLILTVVLLRVLPSTTLQEEPSGCIFVSENKFTKVKLCLFWYFSSYFHYSNSYKYQFRKVTELFFYFPLMAIIRLSNNRVK